MQCFPVKVIFHIPMILFCLYIISQKNEIIIRNNKTKLMEVHYELQKIQSSFTWSDSYGTGGQGFVSTQNTGKKMRYLQMAC